MSTAKSLVSVIIPVYNEAESLEVLHEELRQTLPLLKRPFQIVFVNDGSTDGSAEKLERIAESDRTVMVVHFRRNYGQTTSMMAGIDHSRGDILVPMDADLQNDSADIVALVEELEHGDFDVVSGWRKHRKDNLLLRTIPSRCANWLISLISGVQLHDLGCSLKAYRREMIENVRLYGEMHRFIPIYVHMQGGRVGERIVNHRPRRFGRSKYGLNRIYKILLDLMLLKFLLTYSSKPNHLFGGFGLLCLLGSLLPTGLAVFFKLMPDGSDLHKDFVETPLPVLSAVLFLVGVLAIFQGLLAEMLMRTYFESQGNRPYLVKKISQSKNAAPSS